MTTLSREMRFFIGTYNSAGQPGIYTGTLNPDNGRLGKIDPACPAEAAQNPSFLALSADRRFLYAAIERKEGAVAAFRVEADGRLTLLNEQPAGGAGTCHVSTAGRFVFAANYSSGSFVSFPLNAEGGLEPRSSLIALSASGPNPKRQQQSHAHSIYPMDGGTLVYGCDLGGDHIEAYSISKESGGLEPASRADAPAGVGPRHLAFSADGRWVYACNELDSSLTVYSRDLQTGRLVALRTVPFLPEGVDPAEFGGAEIVLHPNGAWIYVSTRDTTRTGRDKIAFFKAGQEGAVELAAVTPSPVMLPRGMDLDPTGRWLVVAGQGDNRIAVVGVDGESGVLSPAGSARVEIAAPVCVIFER